MLYNIKKTKAVKYDHFDILIWLHDNYKSIDDEWDDEQYICNVAAATGNLKILQWAYANGYYYDEDTCMYAAANGHLEILQWLVGEKCPWSMDTYVMAIIKNHHHIAEWAKANGCLTP